MLYHVHISYRRQGSKRIDYEFEKNLSKEELEERFLLPYGSGSSIVIRGRIIEIGQMDQISVYQTVPSPYGPNGNPFISENDVTSRFITVAPKSSPALAPHQLNEQRLAANSREVLVVHGRNGKARDALFQFLRAIDLHPLEWSEAVASTGKASPYIGEILDAAFSRAQAVVVLFTPDDEARLKEQYRDEGDPPHEIELSGQARPNVLFEAGMAMSRSEDRTVLIELGSLRPFSDIAGRHAIRLDHSSQRRQELAERLRTAGCPVNMSGTDWHAAGDFESAISDITKTSLGPETAFNSGVAGNYQLAISEEARELLLEVAEDAKKRSGTVTKIKSLGGTFIRTNGRNLTDAQDRRSLAKWESAIKELVFLGFLEDPTGNDNVFQITNQGFEAVDSF